MSETSWLVLGFAGQLCFFCRFVVQWWVSEREGRVMIPVAFWYLSLAGGFVVLAYAIHRMDWVFIVGQSFGCLIYLRNLALQRRGDRASKRAADANLS